MLSADVIIAVASPPGRSVRGIVRMSGDGAIDVLAKCAGEVNESVRVLSRKRLRLTGADHDLPVIALIMPGPGSYTGEDAVEIQAPGNPALLDRIVESLLIAADAIGVEARRAEPGEFTARAYLNGRLDLTQAEGVAATIAARSDAELRAAALLRHGVLGSFATELADELAGALALVEAGIDFTDQEDVVAIAPRGLYERLVRCRDRIDAQLSRAVGMEQLEAIPWVVLVGSPNAGKSTLFNALLGRERAVVSDVAGTTRDVLAEPLTIDTDHGPAEVMLIDLAGLDERDDALNKLMQNVAQQAANRAELVLMCSDSDSSREPTARAVDSKNAPTLHIRTKSDICATSAPNTFAVSAHTGAGLAELRRSIADHLADRAVSLAADTLALTPRHEAALRSASVNLREAIALVEPIRDAQSLTDPEFIAASMRAALDELAALAGAITPDDVLGRIFATFCVGK